MHQEMRENPRYRVSWKGTSYVVDVGVAIKNTFHPSMGTKGKLSAVPPAFPHQSGTDTSNPANGGIPVLLSQTAPGRTKRCALNRLSAAGRFSLKGAHAPLFSRS